MTRPPYYPPCFALVSGGKDSLSTAQVLADADRLLGCVCLSTGISTPDWRDFVIDTCRARGWPAEFHHTTSDYEALVRKYGFPGPAMHQQFMTYLKGRAICEFKRKHPSEALEWLAKEPWTAPWWAGRPHGSWPPQMGAQTYNSLSLAGLVRTLPGSWSEKTIAITDEGRAVLSSTEERKP